MLSPVELNLIFPAFPMLSPTTPIITSSYFIADILTLPQKGEIRILGERWRLEKPQRSDVIT